MSALPEFIVHYHLPDRQPFQNLCDIEDEQELARVLQALREKTASGESRRQFTDWYMDKRKQCEIWLREGFAALGGQPKRQSPHYFVWGENEILAGTHPEMRNVRIPLHKLDLSQISFTWPDSMATFDLAQQLEEALPHYGKVLTLDNLKQALDTYGWPREPIIKTAVGHWANMIEVQVWDDDALRHCEPPLALKVGS